MAFMFGQSTGQEQAIIGAVVVAVLLGAIHGANAFLALVDRLTGRREAHFATRSEVEMLRVEVEEIRSQHDELRGMVHGEIGELRKEMNEGFGRVHKRIDDLFKVIQDSKGG